MLSAIHEREGRWSEVDAEAEKINIGRGVGLNEDESLEVFKHLVTNDYIDTGRNLQAPPFSFERAGQWIGFGKINVTVNHDMRLTDKGRAEVE
jgi:hypothetical protein